MHNDPAHDPGAYGRLCIQTRVIALRNVLWAMGERKRAAALIGDRDALLAAVTQPSDAISDATWAG